LYGDSIHQVVRGLTGFSICLPMKERTSSRQKQKRKGQKMNTHP